LAPVTVKVKLVRNQHLVGADDEAGREVAVAGRRDDGDLARRAGEDDLLSHGRLDRSRHGGWCERDRCGCEAREGHRESTYDDHGPPPRSCGAERTTDSRRYCDRVTP
jgi:hypothetical protein